MEYDRIKDYLLSIENEADDDLCKMRIYAQENDVPIVRAETESFLRTLCFMKKPKRILEIGTAIAYSTIVMARADETGESQIVTIESYDKRVPLALENLKKAGLIGNEEGKDRVRLIHGDATKVLKELNGSFDFIFLDAAKGQYINWLPDIMRLMTSGSVLISDNVLQDNTVMESRYTVDRRDRTTHDRMRKFLRELKKNPRLMSSIVPIGDGVSLSIMK